MSAPARKTDAIWVFLVALSIRLALVAWASSRIVPAADGVYYETLGRRISEGQGYTWLWPDGAVTYVAHYPVGLPGLIAGSYRWLGDSPASPMLVLACLGAFGAVGVHRFVAAHGTRVQALFAGLAFALHPDLVSYGPALMTEGLTASLIALGLWIATVSSSTPARRIGIDALLGVVVALATYVRPQCILLVVALPSLGVVGKRWTSSYASRPWVRYAVVLVATLALLAPWTLRNGEKLGRHALVSVNGGWNLAIGTDPDANGTWAPIVVPPACREVFDEAGKDRCFGDEARKTILGDPVAWLKLAPLKLAQTFDYAGAGAWYLHDSNPRAFSAHGKTMLGAVSLLAERLVLALALAAAWSRLRALATEKEPPWSLWLGRAALALGAAFLFQRHAYVTVLVLFGLLAGGSIRAWLRRRRASSADHVIEHPAYDFALFHGVTTALVHVVFFGAGRYGLVVYPALVALAALAPFKWPRDRPKIQALPA